MEMVARGLSGFLRAPDKTGCFALRWKWMLDPRVKLDAIAPGGEDRNPIKIDALAPKELDASPSPPPEILGDGDVGG